MDKWPLQIATVRTDFPADDRARPPIVKRRLTRKDPITVYGPDTRGEELPEVEPKRTPTQQKHVDTQYLNRNYAGAPIPATRLYIRGMPEITNTSAALLVAINNDANTVTYLNTYRAGELPASYNPAHYTYPITDKNRGKLEQKLNDMREIERDEWPPFIVAAANKRRSKTTN